MGQWWSQPPSPTPRPNATTQFSLSSLLPSALFPQRSTSTQPITAQNSTSTQPITAQNFIHQQQSNRPRRPREPFTVDGGDDDGFELGRRTRARSTFTSVEDSENIQFAPRRSPRLRRIWQRGSNDSMPPIEPDNRPATADFTNSPQGHSVLRQSLETVLYSLLQEQRTLRNEMEEENLRIQSFYFYGTFSARVATQDQSTARSSSSSSPSSDIPADSYSNTIDVFESVNSFVERHGNMQRTMERQWLSDVGLTLSVTIRERETPPDNLVQIPLIIVGTHDTERENQSLPDPPAGWVMYVVGGPQTAEGLSSLVTQVTEAQRENASSSFTATSQVTGVRGRFVLITNMDELIHTRLPHNDNESSNPNEAENELRENLPNIQTIPPPPPPIGGSSSRSLGTLMAAMLTGLGLSDEILPAMDMIENLGEMDTYDLFSRLADYIGPAIPRNADRTTVDRELPVMLFKEVMKHSCENLVDKTVSSTGCTVCLSPFDDADAVRVLKCGHVYHQQCIDEWLCRHVNNCPLCRTAAVTVEDETNDQT